MAKTVTVIIPAYNVEAFIRGCIESVTSQTYKELEILVVNDGSTDGTLKLIEDQAGKDARIKLINRENGGLSAARNSGIDRVSGDYVAFLDGDDCLVPSAIEELMNAAVVYPDMIIAADRSLKKDGEAATPREGMLKSCKELTSGEALMDIAKGSYYLQSVCHKLFPAKIVKFLKFDEDIKQGEDRIYMHRAISASAGVYYMNRPLWEVFIRSGSLSRSKLSMRWLDSIKALDRMIAESDGTLRNEYKRYRMELIVLFVGAYISRDSNDKEFFAEIRKLGRDSLAEYKTLEKGKKELLAARIYLYFPETLLRLYIKLTGRVM